ncbi:Transcription initiation factor TFIID subunit 5 [Elsinoe australis]|uniref:Transcription initiation factor TFIID subunit 5 n=1 Tax=Elsinoe australis TaxID=40998 RepID=A0A2P7Z4C8_9PEZI|nr:Transcription initiation factor TFIID subunit 5 [Elsinoe australis]
MSSTHLTDKSKEQFHPKNNIAASNMDDKSTASVNKSTASKGEFYTSEVKDGTTKDQKTRHAEFQEAVDKRDGIVEEYNASVDRIEAAEKMHDELEEKFEAAPKETAAIQKDLKAAEQALTAKLDEHKDRTWRLWEKIIEEASKLEATKKDFLAHVLDSGGQKSEGDQSEAEMARTGDEKGNEQETKVD